MIDEKETWLPDSADPHGENQIADLVPAVSLLYLNDYSSQGPGSGKSLSYRYSLIDPSFQSHWEILYDW